MPNKAHNGAYRKGIHAHAEGKTRNQCPYSLAHDNRKLMTGTRGFANAWLRGWDEAEEKRKDPGCYIIRNVVGGGFYRDGSWTNVRGRATVFENSLDASDKAKEFNFGIGMRVERV